MIPKVHTFHSYKYTILADGLWSHPNFAEGRLIPGVILESNEKLNPLKELVAIHSEISTGDVKIVWGIPISNILKKKRLTLRILFLKPMNLDISIYFDVQQHYSLIDAIIQSRGLTLGLGNVGDSFSKKFEKGEMVTIEVPQNDFDKKWDKWHFDILKKHFKKKGFKNKDLKDLINGQIKHGRDILELRRKN